VFVLNNYVLFSPVGTTDPIRGMYDGPMLHIVRHYKPDKIYLYFTKEMSKKREEIQNALAPFDIEIKEIVTDIDNPHDFDIFAKTFDELLIEIQKENLTGKILINISSGTPQIKSALCLEVVSSHLKLKPIQVLTPSEKSNVDIAYGGDIEENLDDLMEKGNYLSPNRCIEPDILSFKRTAVKRDLISLISHFEYRAALEKFNENDYLFDDKVAGLIEYAMLRQNDNENYRKSKWNKEFYYTKDARAAKACDYYCILDNKSKTGELSYFVLLLKPLSEYIAEDFTGFLIEEEAIAILDKYYLQKTGRKYNPTYIKIKGRDYLTFNLQQYIAIMEHKGLSGDVIYDFNIILEQLEIRRNDLAHELYREDEINSDKALKVVKRLLIKIYGNRIKEKSLRLYENINKKIIEML